MPVIKSVDLFIERSAKLIEARPERTHVSITYGKNKAAKADSEKETRKTKNFVSFKVYDPVTGICIKTKTYKMKEVSRLLNFLGPRGVQVTKVKPVVKKPKTQVIGEGEDKVDADGDVKIVDDDAQEPKSEIVYQRGISSLMANKEFDNQADSAVPAVEKEASAVPASTDSNTEKSKKSKKKSNKKR